MAKITYRTVTFMSRFYLLLREPTNSPILEGQLSLFERFYYPPAVAKVGLRLADESAGHAQVILEVVVEVPTEAAGALLVGAWHAHLQVRASAPQNLEVAGRV